MSRRRVFLLVLSIHVTLLLAYLAYGAQVFARGLMGSWSKPSDDTGWYQHVGSALSGHQDILAVANGRTLGPIPGHQDILAVANGRTLGPIPGHQDILAVTNGRTLGPIPGHQDILAVANGRTLGPIQEDSLQGGGDSSESELPAVFQPIDGKEAWLYSAFYNHVSAKRERPLVRLFGVTHDKFHTKANCLFSQDDQLYNSSGRITRLPEWHWYRYTAVYLECDIPKDARPTYVSVSFNSTTPATNRLLIQYPGPRTRNFTVCYSVLHNNYDSATMLIENIEMNRILGADHFYVYNYSISPRVDKILRHYQQEGLITVVPWSIPTLNIWYFAQLCSINDCLHRNRNVSRFVVVVDTDEFLIPRNQMTWMELIHTFSPEEKDVKALMNPASKKTGDRITACFNTRSSNFYTDVIPRWDSLPAQYKLSDVEKNNLTKYSAVTLTQFWRQNFYFRAGVRSKYIVRPELVVVAGVHFVYTFEDNWYKCAPFWPGLSILQHYRVTGNSSKAILDTNLLKFKTKLYPRLIERFHALL